MTFYTEGVIIALITISFVGIELAVNKGIRKVTNTYWFGLAISIFYIVYCIVICWGSHGSHFAHLEIIIGRPMDGSQSHYTSYALLLNICPFLNFALPIFLISDPSRKAARALAPFGLLSSAFVIMLAIPTSSTSHLTGSYFLFGEDNGFNLFWFGHAMNLFISMGVILNTPKFGGKGTISTFGALLGFYMYVLIMCAGTGCQYDCSGMNLNDFGENGTYNIFGSILHNEKLSAAIFFPSFFIFIFGTILLIDLCKRGYFAYGDKFSGTWGKGYDYKTTTIKEPGGGFSHNGQLKHKKNIKLKLNKK